MSQHDDVPESNHGPQESTSAEQHTTRGNGSPTPVPPLPRSQSLDINRARGGAVPGRPSLSPSRTVSDAGRRSSQHHVRFSTDLERPSPEEVRGPDTDRRPGSRGLTINTSIAQLQVPSSGRSPGHSATSPLSPNSTLSPPSPQSPESGGRSRSRHRGYSLRRTIFAKNIESAVTSPGAIELGPAQAVSPQEGASADVSERKSEEVPRQSTEDEKQDVLVTQKSASDPNLDLSTTYYSESSDNLKNSRHLSTSVSYEKWLKRKAVVATLMLRLEDMLETARKTILRIKDIPPSKDGRHIDLDATRTEALIDERTGNP
ncbi:unnamed protein product [Aspergillus niger]|nr:unnamed protein product [Aspergillus niger]